MNWDSNEINRFTYFFNELSLIYSFWQAHHVNVDMKINLEKAAIGQTTHWHSLTMAVRKFAYFQISESAWEFTIRYTIGEYNNLNKGNKIGFKPFY